MISFFRINMLHSLKILLLCCAVQLLQPAAAAGILPENVQAELEQQWGIRVISLRQSAAGYMLDFRYKVTDPVKAKKVLDRSIKPQLIVTSTGNHLQVPAPSKIGPLRQSSREPRTDTNYFIFFANPRRQVNIGDEVSIQIGKLEIPGLKVSNS
ncbi:hypothetical protein [Amphritea pacifica]|uniref:Uncharacterized protein n=2 Tax=Amphritea pacifica TaxID=2811233 RepID=A0ABS2W7E7_9GAMM|nr:hypothetical protein [Amphritea pacifica]MBN0987525.1 hypothetical protein [Amphritea pacifica]